MHCSLFLLSAHSCNFARQVHHRVSSINFHVPDRRCLLQLHSVIGTIPPQLQPLLQHLRHRLLVPLFNAYSIFPPMPSTCREALHLRREECDRTGSHISSLTGGEVREHPSLSSQRRSPLLLHRQASALYIIDL